MLRKHLLKKAPRKQLLQVLGSQKIFYTKVVGKQPLEIWVRLASHSNPPVPLPFEADTEVGHQHEEFKVCFDRQVLATFK